MGLDPGSPGSYLRLQAALNRCATGAAPISIFLKILFESEQEKERGDEEGEGEAEERAEV